MCSEDASEGVGGHQGPPRSRAGPEQTPTVCGKLSKNTMARAGTWELGAGVTSEKSRRCGGRAHLRDGKVCACLSKMIPEEHNRLCPWGSRQDRPSFPRAPETDAAHRTASQREPKQYTDQSISPRPAPHLIKTPERLSNDWALLVSPRYPLRGWMELPRAVLGKEQFPPLGLGWGHGVRVSLKLTQWELLKST